MFNDEMLNNKIKNVNINKIDVVSKVMDNINGKKIGNVRKRVILIAAILILSVSVVFASSWIIFNQDDSYTITTEDKQWNTVFDLDDNEELVTKFFELYNELSEIALNEEKDLIGYYYTDELENPLILTTKMTEYFSKSRMDEFYDAHQSEWTDVVEKSIPKNFSLNGASVQTTYSNEYYKSWIEHAENIAINGELYYEEIDAKEKPFSMKLRYSRVGDGTVYRLDASIVMEASVNSIDSNHVESEIVDVRGYEAVYTNLDGNYKLLELEFKDNLLSLHGKLKSDSKEIRVKGKVNY